MPLAGDRDALLLALAHAADAHERRRIRRRVRARRVDQGADRPRLSSPDRWCVSGDDAQPCAPAALASTAGNAGFFGDCRAVACGGGDGESYRGAPGCAAHARECARVVLVLLRQRTLPALPRQAHPARLRHGSAAGLLGTDVPVAVSVVGVSCGSARCRIRWRQIARRHQPAAARGAALRHLGGGDPVVLQLLHPAGVLRASPRCRRWRC